MISFDVMAEIPASLVQCVGQPGQHGVERDAAIGMRLRIEEDLHMGDVLGGDFFKVGVGQVEEIQPGEQHGHSGIVQVEKILQRAEADRLAGSPRRRRVAR